MLENATNISLQQITKKIVKYNRSLLKHSIHKYIYFKISDIYIGFQ